MALLKQVGSVKTFPTTFPRHLLENGDGTAHVF